MSASRIEPEHLEPLYEAKQRFNNVLKPRIKEYEDRLKKNFLQRAAEYIETGYGLKGYERTQKFLNDMNEERISSTEKLIDLTKCYTEGYTLPLILKLTVLEICQFNNNHVSLVQQELTANILRQYPPKKASLLLIAIENKSINHIYKNITLYPDYGSAYLNQLNHSLRNTTNRLR